MKLTFRTLSQALVGLLPTQPQACYVGDPCYVVPGHLWDEFCSGIGQCDGPWLFSINGQPAGIVASTAFGDGKFPVTYRGISARFGVDAGLFAIIPLEFLSLLSPKPSDVALGATIHGLSLGSATRLSVETGNLSFQDANGFFSIVTGDAERNEEDDTDYGCFSDEDAMRADEAAEELGPATLRISRGYEIER